MDIAGKIAVITGAARGIGQATAVALAEAGAKAVVLADIRESELSETSKMVAAAGAEPVTSCTDVGDLKSLRALFSDTEARFGRLDILHNNAGLGEGPPDWPGITPERSVAIIDINLRGVILGTQLALELMQKNGGGAIVNTASGGAFVPLPPQAVYVATKAGVVHFTRSCAPLSESHGVRVNCVCPGLTDTDMVQESGADGVAPWLRPMFDSVDLLTPRDIADAVLDLIRDDSKVAEIVSVENVQP
jgi:NAD(P)-dependent dehydrogenase (short-subunit alcohol dehydrogenase family)